MTGPTQISARTAALKATRRTSGSIRCEKCQIKNFLLTLLISRGVPMLLGGDEFAARRAATTTPTARTMKTSWMDWNNLEQHQEIYRLPRA